MTNFLSVKKFMETFGQEVKTKAEFPSDKIIKLRYDLIKEELGEFEDAIKEFEKSISLLPSFDAYQKKYECLTKLGAYQSKEEKKSPVFTRNDLLLLTKARLSFLVIITTVVGFILASKSNAVSIDWWLLIHTIIGCAFAAAASSIFNQLMEIDIDSKMSRTAVRPLPSKKIKPAIAFVLGWVFAAIGLVHLAVKVTPLSCAFAAATLFVYMFVYTPMKRKTGLNTLVGAVSGALPPLIGWAGAGGGFDLFAPYFLFGLLFLWQLPHFVAINWMYREEYESAGFMMWSNGDLNGKKKDNLAIVLILIQVG